MTEKEIPIENVTTGLPMAMIKEEIPIVTDPFLRTTVVRDPIAAKKRVVVR